MQVTHVRAWHTCVSSYHEHGVEGGAAGQVNDEDGQDEDGSIRVVYLGDCYVVQHQFQHYRLVGWRRKSNIREERSNLYVFYLRSSSSGLFIYIFIYFTAKLCPRLSYVSRHQFKHYKLTGRKDRAYNTIQPFEQKFSFTFWQNTDYLDSFLTQWVNNYIFYCWRLLLSDLAM